MNFVTLPLNAIGDAEMTKKTVNTLLDWDVVPKVWHFPS